MHDPSKINLSPAEQLAVESPDLILTKLAVQEKAEELLASMTAAIDECFAPLIKQSNIPVKPPKISRGENYRGLPYAILDHPAFFSGDDGFAVRTMFWWGNFFSVTLHLRGRYASAFSDIIRKNIGQQGSLYACINDDEWQHQNTADNYLPIAEAMSSFPEICSRSFIKLAYFYPLKEWNAMRGLLNGGYRSIASLFAP